MSKQRSGRGWRDFLDDLGRGLTITTVLTAAFSAAVWVSARLGTESLTPYLKVAAVFCGVAALAGAAPRAAAWIKLKRDPPLFTFQASGGQQATITVNNHGSPARLIPYLRIVSAPIPNPQPEWSSAAPLTPYGQPASAVGKGGFALIRIGASGQDNYGVTGWGIYALGHHMMCPFVTVELRLESDPPHSKGTTIKRFKIEVGPMGTVAVTDVPVD